MFTTKAGKLEHNHMVDVDGQGSGHTIDTSYGPPHTHEITNWIVSKNKVGGEPHIHEVVNEHLAYIKEGQKPKIIDKEQKPLVLPRRKKAKKSATKKSRKRRKKSR